MAQDTTAHSFYKIIYCLIDSYCKSWVKLRQKLLKSYSPTVEDGKFFVLFFYVLWILNNCVESIYKMQNNCVESIYKMQKTRTKILPSAMVDE